MNARIEMTVGTFIDFLKQYPQDARVVVAGDEEGNHFGDPAIFAPEEGKDGGQVITIFPMGFLMADDIFKDT